VPSLNGGQLAGFRNVLINGDMRINQRGVTIAAAANGAYGPDRWKKVDASNMTQVVEAGNFTPGVVYTLSGTGVTTQQLTAPASGDWALPSIPTSATKIQLELGTVATPFEHRPIGLELMLCQRYFQLWGSGVTWAAGSTAATGGYNETLRSFGSPLPVQMRATPTVTYASNNSATGGSTGYMASGVGHMGPGGISADPRVGSGSTELSQLNVTSSSFNRVYLGLYNGITWSGGVLVKGYTYGSISNFLWLNSEL
jgi:hypothetical protein